VHQVPATAWAVAGINFVFDGGQLLHEPRRVRPTTGEIRSFRWMSADELADETDPRTRKRVLAALQQRNSGTGTAYLTGTADEPPSYTGDLQPTH
jgi:hypothetical protein